jgi:hypothetical protein
MSELVSINRSRSVGLGICSTDEFEDALVETALEVPLVRSTKEDLLSLTFAPHGAAIVPQMVELNPIDKGFLFYRRILQASQLLLGLTSNDATLSPLIRHIRMLVDGATLKGRVIVTHVDLLQYHALSRAAQLKQDGAVEELSLTEA